MISIKKIIIVSNFEKDYQELPPQLVNHQVDNYKEYYYAYNFKDNKDPRRLEYNKILKYAYKNNIEVELYFRFNMNQCYKFYGSGFIVDFYKNKNKNQENIFTYELVVNCDNLKIIKKDKSKNTAYPFVQGCLINSNCKSSARQWPGVYVEY